MPCLRGAGVGSNGVHRSRHLCRELLVQLVEFALYVFLELLGLGLEHAGLLLE